MSKKLPLISVIIPVYNVEKYLQRCIDSVLAQTYNNIEVILIDDGSTDSCGKICDEFAGRAPRVRVVHKKNGGLSDARNVGIELAKGEYITFVDSDDFIDLDMIEYLFTLAKWANARMSVCVNRLYDEDTGRFKTERNDGKKEILTSHESLRRMLYHQDFFVSACGKLYQKKMFEHIRFPVGKLYEDTSTIYKLVIRAEMIGYGRACKYNYCIRNGSITRSKFNEKQLDLVVAADSAVSDIVRNFPDLEQAGMRFRIWARFSTLNRMFSIDSRFYPARDEIIQFIRTHADDVFRDANTPSRDKLGILALKIGLPFYKVGWDLYAAIKMRL